MEDLHKLYPGTLPDISMSKMMGTTADKRLAYFYKVLESLRDSWLKGHNGMAKFTYNKSSSNENDNLDEVVDRVVATLDCIGKIARELFDAMDKPAATVSSCTLQLTDGCDNNGGFVIISNSSDLSQPVRVQGAQNSTPLKQNDEKVEELKPETEQKTNNSEMMPAATAGNFQNARQETESPIQPNMDSETAKSSPTPLPTMTPKGSVQSAPPSQVPSKGTVAAPITPAKGTPGPPPPPPLGAGKLLNQKRADTKLRRSMQMITLFQNLKRKMEGSSFAAKSANERKKQFGGSTGGKQGMAASIAELRKRSSYFQRIEEDVQKHTKSIMELKIAINSFQTKDMSKLLKFQKNVDSFLEVLIDENQVLAKFEDFPTKKLEIVRTASALYSKLDKMVSDLKEWKIVPPLRQLLERFESYFSKIKLELDAIERAKDDVNKKLKSHSIDFDFNILTRIKELMVDVSSSCMQLALKERRYTRVEMANEENKSESDEETKESMKMLWRAFQLAFKVYTFAGGQDDHADKLAKELAQKILTGKEDQ